MFYDDELHENSCDLVQERLQEHFQSEPEGIFIQVYYEKKDDRAIIWYDYIF